MNIIIEVHADVTPEVITPEVITMVKRCNVDGCDGNKRGEEYTKMVSFPPKDDAEYERYVLICETFNHV